MSTKKPEYSATIKVLGKIYTSKGKTLREAIEMLKPIGVTKGISLLTLSKGDVQRQKILGNIQTFRLFSPSRLTREIAIKNTSLLFDL